MDKISKRSKGYAFIEYTMEEAASAALKEMNGKVSLHASSSSKIFLLCLMFKHGFVLLQLWFIIVYKSKITLRIRERVMLYYFVSRAYRLLMAG
jgi:RNA recognition motif-containing protein